MLPLQTPEKVYVAILTNPDGDIQIIVSPIFRKEKRLSPDDVLNEIGDGMLFNSSIVMDFEEATITEGTNGKKYIQFTNNQKINISLEPLKQAEQIHP